jgi:hypothetical protein
MRIYTHEIMKNYESGILKDIDCHFDPKSNLGRGNSHAILAVGWGIDQNNGEYVIL